MKLYHASNCVTTHPDVYHSRDYLDFGKGFYLTSLRDQAQNYARRFTRRGGTAYVNEFDFDDSILEVCRLLQFDAYDEAWLDFILACRTGADTTDWDVIVGGIANDKVFRTVDLYLSGDLSKDEALGRLKYERPNNQLCIRSQSVIESGLKHINHYEVH
jgi:hypothetical protein